MWWMISRPARLFPFRSWYWSKGKTCVIARRHSHDAFVSLSISSPPWSSDCVRLCTRPRGLLNIKVWPTCPCIINLGSFLYTTIGVPTYSAALSSWCLTSNIRVLCVSMEFLAVVFISFSSSYLKKTKQKWLVIFSPLFPFNLLSPQQMRTGGTLLP